MQQNFERRKAEQQKTSDNGPMLGPVPAYELQVIKIRDYFSSYFEKYFKDRRQQHTAFLRMEQNIRSRVLNRRQLKSIIR